MKDFIIQNLGVEGYGRWCLFKELLAENVDENGNIKRTFTVKELLVKLCAKKKTLFKFLFFVEYLMQNKLKSGVENIILDCQYISEMHDTFSESMTHSQNVGDIPRMYDTFPECKKITEMCANAASIDPLATISFSCKSADLDGTVKAKHDVDNCKNYSQKPECNKEKIKVGAKVGTINNIYNNTKKKEKKEYKKEISKERKKKEKKSLDMTDKNVLLLFKLADRINFHTTRLNVKKRNGDSIATESVQWAGDLNKNAEKLKSLVLKTKNNSEILGYGVLPETDVDAFFVDMIDHHAENDWWVEQALGNGKSNLNLETLFLREEKFKDRMLKFLPLWTPPSRRNRDDSNTNSSTGQPIETFEF